MGVIWFDEFVGIVFVDDWKVYVVFLVENKIVVIDVELWCVIKWLNIMV